jgi:hypothetical protein
MTTSADLTWSAVSTNETYCTSRSGTPHRRDALGSMISQLRAVTAGDTFVISAGSYGGGRAVAA